MATATFITTDTTTQGSWIGVYGGDGYEFPLDLSDSPPGYLATFDVQDSSFSPASTYEWAQGTELRRLQNPADPTGIRYAITWYATTGIYLFLDVGATTRRVAVYCLDDDGTDNGGGAGRRSQTFDVRDVDNSLALLDSQSVGNFEAGKWLVWDITGNVRIDVTRTGAQNAVIAAVMFETPGGGPISGSLAVTLADATLAASVSSTITGSASPTLANATLVSTASARAAGVLAKILDDAALAATVTSTITGSLSATLADAVLHATAFNPEAVVRGYRRHAKYSAGMKIIHKITSRTQG